MRTPKREFEEIRGLFPEADPREWYIHGKGGGWVQKTAYVAPSVEVDCRAIVYERAKVFGNVKIGGEARIYGDCIIKQDATVYDSAHVYGHAQIMGSVIVGGFAHVYEEAVLTDSVYIGGSSLIHGNIYISGHAAIYGSVKVKEYCYCITGLSQKITIADGYVHVEQLSFPFDWWINPLEVIKASLPSYTKESTIRVIQGFIKAIKGE